MYNVHVHYRILQFSNKLDVMYVLIIIESECDCVNFKKIEKKNYM